MLDSWKLDGIHVGLFNLQESTGPFFLMVVFKSSSKVALLRNIQFNCPSCGISTWSSRSRHLRHSSAYARIRLVPFLYSLTIYRYTADWKNGYNAEVTYEGEAVYPEEKPQPTRPPTPTKKPYENEEDIGAYFS